MRKLITAALLACACAHTAEPVKPAPAQALAPPEPTPAEHYKLARQAMVHGQWDEARQHLDASLAKEPKNAAGWFDAGWVSERLGDLKAAQADYYKVLELEPAQLGAVTNLVRLLAADDAEKVLRVALEQRVDDPRLLDALASVQRNQKKLDAAEETVQRVLARHPRDADAYRILAAIEADRGHLRLAESALNNARKLMAEERALPATGGGREAAALEDAGILNDLGLLAMRRDDEVTARADFEEAVKMDAGFAAAWANLGALALRYRDYASAETSYAKAIANGGNRWETRLAHGWALEGLKKPKDARAEYEKVLVQQPAQEDALYGRAVALRAEGDLPSAMQAFKDYAASGKTHLKEAQSQIAQIDLRLKNPPAQLKAAAKPAPAQDLTKLPQGTDTAPAAELPTEESPAADKPGENPAAGSDAGVQNATTTTAKAGGR